MNPKREEFLLGIGKVVVTSEIVGGGSIGRKESPRLLLIRGFV